MKKVLIYNLVLLLLFVGCNKIEPAFSSYIDITAESLIIMMNGTKRPTGSYDYPDNLAKFETEEEKMYACEIPFQKAEEMSAEALIQAYLEHPLLVHIVSNKTNYQIEFDLLFGNSNLLKQLQKHKKAPSVLASKYLEYTWGDIKYYYTDLLFSSYEVLCAQIFVTSYTKEEAKQIVKKALAHHTAKLENSIFTELYLIGRILVNFNAIPKEEISMINGIEQGDIIDLFGNVESKKNIQILIKLAQEFINN